VCLTSGVLPWSQAVDHWWQGPQGDEDGQLLPLQRKLKVCTMSADFWGLPTAGGTATAYGLLTSALSEDTSLDVHTSLCSVSSWPFQGLCLLYASLYQWVALLLPILQSASAATFPASVS